MSCAQFRSLVPALSRPDLQNLLPLGGSSPACLPGTPWEDCKKPEDVWHQLRRPTPLSLWPNTPRRGYPSLFLRPRGGGVQLVSLRSGQTVFREAVRPEGSQAVGRWRWGRQCFASGWPLRASVFRRQGRVTGSLGVSVCGPRTCREASLSLTALPGPSAHPRTWQSCEGPQAMLGPPRDLPCSSCATCRRSSATSCTSARSSPWLGTHAQGTALLLRPGVQPPHLLLRTWVQPSSLVPRPGVQAPAPLGSDLCSCAPTPGGPLNVPTVLTEQYPQGLGPTVPELGLGLQPHSKICFSMVPVVQQELDARPQLRSVLLCGLETQACILVRPPLTLGPPLHLRPPQPETQNPGRSPS